MVRSKKSSLASAATGSLAPVPLQQRLHESYDTLPQSERKIADLILDFPGEVAAYNATELAALAGASKAAVTRLVRRLGYPNFEAARRTARDVRDRGAPLYMLHSTARTQAFETRRRAHLERDAANLSRTLEALDPLIMSKVVDALAKARRLWLFGSRNSHYLAGYARSQFIQVRKQVHLLPMAGETLAEHMDEMGVQDVLMLVALRRRVPVVERVLALADERGAQVLLVTDSAARLRGRAHWTLRCEVRGEDLFDRYTGALSLLHLLSVELAAQLGASGRRRMERIEHLHKTLDELA